MTATPASSSPAPRPRSAIGVDVGGTKILAGRIAPDGTVLVTERRPTPKDGEALVDALVAAVVDLCDEGERETVPVCVCYPGLLSHDGHAHYGPNVGLRDYPLRQVLRERLGNPDLEVDNDANAAAWAEFSIGVGRDCTDSLAIFTLGTGVGGGLVVNGRLLRGAHGMAGELGHMVIHYGGESGPSGIPGELEAYSSGTAIGRMAAEAHAAGRFAGTSLDGPVAPDGAAVTDAAMAGEAEAVAILRDVGRHLGVGASVIVNSFDPEMIVVGGGAAAGGELVLTHAREALAAHTLGFGDRPPVPLVAAELGPEAGMIGAGLLALERRGAQAT